MDVGKLPGAPAWRQDQIDRAIVSEAREGRRVVRRMGGDPSVFGRAEEELRAARAAGVAVKIVPRVTAPAAAVATLGRTLTEPGATSRLVIATAVAGGGAAPPDLAGALIPGTTLAIYTGAAAFPYIRAALAARGLYGTTEIEIVRDACTGREAMMLARSPPSPQTRPARRRR